MKGCLRLPGVTADEEGMEATHNIERKLREQEQKYRRIFEMAGVSIWEEDWSEVKSLMDDLHAGSMPDLRGYLGKHLEVVQRAISLVRIRDVNQHSLAMFGASTKQQLMASVTDIVVPETHGVFIDKLVALVQGARYLESETVTRTLQGKPLSVLFTIVFPDRDQPFDSVLVCLLDISQRRQADMALRESEARFRNMAEHAPVMIWITDASRTCIYVNRRCHEFTGSTDGDALRAAWMEYVHTDDRAASTKLFREANEQRRPCRLEYRFRRHDGQFRWVIDSASPRFSTTGEYLGFIGSVIDITERKDIEEQLQYQLRLNRTITDNAVSCLFMMDVQGRPTFMNPAAEKVTGYTLDEIKDRPLHDAVHHHFPDGRAYRMEDCPIEQSSTTQVPIQNHDDVFVRKDGSFFPVICAVAPLEQNGRMMGAVLEFRDVTEQKRAEAERERLLKELQMERRRLEISQTDLQEKIDDLEKFHDVVVGRELKMMQLEKEAVRLREELTRRK